VPSILFVPNDEIALDETRIEAQTVASENSEAIQLQGGVNLRRRFQSVDADSIVITKSSEEIEATGNVIFTDPDHRIASSEVRIDNRNDRAEFEQSQFELRQRHARGEAERIEKLDESRSRYSDLTYTSCDPDDSSWHMRASQLDIDRESGRGAARHTVLYARNVPFFYLPYLQFPIDDRRMSGLLTPRFGIDDYTGTAIILPVYWNQAPNYDMTITPAYYSDLGLQLNTENRYLLGGHRGQLDLSYLDDRKFGDSRWFGQWQHATGLPFGLQAGVLLAEVSDGDFFDDFDTVAPQYNNIRHLERYLRIGRDDAYWQSELVWQNYQTLDELTAVGNRPYDRLPRFTLNAQPEVLQGQVLLPVQFEWVSFEREDSVTGKRAHLVPAANWRSSNSWYFFEPNLQVAFTDYQLEDNPGGNEINRTLPTLSIDSGLIFERDAGAGGQWRQTLEPRLYFLYTPYEDQDDIPDFDTSLASNSYSNLFRNNRFYGADRIGDAKQVTVGLASRMFDSESGSELLHARAGQIFYFEDRRVTLSGIPEEETRSDLIGELDWWPYSTLTLRTRLVYDPDEKDIYDRDFTVNYSKSGFAANLAYYYTVDELEQALVSMAYPVNERWDVVAKVHHSLKFDKPVENLLGVSYESCCWGLKILAGQTGKDKEQFAVTDNSIYFEITLKGLSAAGQDIDSRLSRAIPGYRPAF